MALFAMGTSWAPVRADIDLYRDDNSHASLICRAGMAAFSTNNAFFGNPRPIIGSDPDNWFEAFSELGMTASLQGDLARIYGGVSAVATRQDDEDPRGHNTKGDVNLEKAYIGVSTDQIKDLGNVDFSAGRQDFHIGSGFLIWDGTLIRGNGSAYQFDPRQAWKMSSLLKITTDFLKFEAFYLEPDAEGDARRMTVDGKIAGWNVDFALDPRLNLGLTYLHVFDGDSLTRRDTDVYDGRLSVAPFNFLPDLVFSGEGAIEKHSSKAFASAYTLQAQYTWRDLPWQPSVGYRYARFSGDDPDTQNRSEAFDPLAYGGSDWGTWFQGEIVGHYLMLNSNLVSHFVRFDVHPTSTISAGIYAYRFFLDQPKSAGVSSNKLADEIDLAATWIIHGPISLTAVIGSAFPRAGGRELTGGDETWILGKFFVNVRF